MRFTETVRQPDRPDHGTRGHHRVRDCHGEQRPGRDRGRPDDNLWFTEGAGNQISRMTTTAPGPCVVDFGLRSA